MFKFFDTIFDTLTLIFTYISNSFYMVGVAFKTMGYAIAFPFRYVASLPGPVILLITVFLSYCIVMNLINKGS